MPEAQAGPRRAAVNAYLARAGVPADKVELAVGPNPHLTTPTAYNLATVYKAEGNANMGEGRRPRRPPAASAPTAPAAPSGSDRPSIPAGAGHQGGPRRHYPRIDPPV